MKILEYNHNLIRNKRPHRKITKFGNFKSLSERLIAEIKALNQYLNRTNQKQ